MRPPNQPTSEQFAEAVMQATLQLALAINELKMSPPPGGPPIVGEDGFPEDIIFLALSIHTETFELRLRKQYEQNRSKGSSSPSVMMAHMKGMARDLRKWIMGLAKQAVPNLENLTDDQKEQLLALLLSEPAGEA